LHTIYKLIIGGGVYAMNRKFVMFVKPTRIKLVVTIIIVFIASFFFCGVYGTAIPEACIVWVSPLLFPMVLWYGFPEVVIEWGNA